MLVVRPIKKTDYQALRVCAEESGHGFTSLPVNEELLTSRINHSVESFAKKEVTQPQGEDYLMVGVDSETGEVAGTTAIEAGVGLDVPFYTYHISTIVHSSKRLGLIIRFRCSLWVIITPDVLRCVPCFSDHPSVVA